jgi:hypothetical protein
MFIAPPAHYRHSVSGTISNIRRFRQHVSSLFPPTPLYVLLYREFLQEIRLLPARATRCAGLPELPNSASEGTPSEAKNVPFRVKGVPYMLKGTPFEAGLPDYEARTDRPEARLPFPSRGTTASCSAHRQRQRGSDL